MISDSVLVQTITAALKEWDNQKAEGALLEERVANLEKTLRVSWPFTREWKYLCNRCDDNGLVISNCPGDATCGRYREHLAHEFGTPCWCSRGEPFKPKAKTEATAVEQAAQIKKPTRFGR